MNYRKFFTLLELLIVVSVLGILLTLLLPSLGAARDKAFSAVCMSNLKQIGVGAYLYGKDNKSYMPTSNIDSTAFYSPGMMYYTSKYTLSETIDKEAAIELTIDLRGTIYDEPVLVGNNLGGIDDPVASGYGWNWRYMGYKQEHNNKKFASKLFGGIEQPSESILAGDTSDDIEFEAHRYLRYQNVGKRHQNRINALIADGSSESVSSISLTSNNNSKWWYKDEAH
ncbi:MAG: prepilin-type N-terminal cleavage/methylation domain-containing protein [Lentisphaeraceae bacterium]|nr:prepilin-type N-terminal cleavage/methylation domain-containing protein [Lentisphaeraceae bacterium]